MPLRDSTDLTDFNFFNEAAYMTYDKWFDLADFLRSALPFKGLTADWKRKDSVTTGVRISGRSVANGPEGMVFELFAEDVTERRALEAVE